MARCILEYVGQCTPTSDNGTTDEVCNNRHRRSNAFAIYAHDALLLRYASWSDTDHRWTFFACVREVEVKSQTTNVHKKYMLLNLCLCIRKYRRVPDIICTFTVANITSALRPVKYNVLYKIRHLFRIEGKLSALMYLLIAISFAIKRKWNSVKPF